MNFGSVLGGQVVKLYNEFPEEKVITSSQLHVYRCVL